MRGAIHPFPQHVFMAWCLVKHRGNFNFYFYIHLHFLKCAVHVPTERVGFSWVMGWFVRSNLSGTFQDSICPLSEREFGICDGLSVINSIILRHRIKIRRLVTLFLLLIVKETFFQSYYFYAFISQTHKRNHQLYFLTFALVFHTDVSGTLLRIRHKYYFSVKIKMLLWYCIYPAKQVSVLKEASLYF
jgi:hypothetical protein